MQTFSWQQLSNKDKKNIGQNKPILILGPRQISDQRILELTKKIAGKKPVIWGCLNDKFIPGLENSPQFQTLSLAKLKQSLKKLDKKFQAKVSILQYDYRYTKYLIRELDLSAVVGLYGSWYKAFHFTPIFYELIKKKLNYKLMSNFVDEDEARSYELQIKKQFPKLSSLIKDKMSDEQLLNLADAVSRRSFDYTFQTGAVLARDQQVLLTVHNRILPYETYALQHGATKEKHFSPPQDLNHFDTNHAEVELILKALAQKLDLTNSNLYINLLPCPTCAKMLAATPIKKIFYRHDHSQGYAHHLLTQMNKKLIRVT